MPDPQPRALVLVFDGIEELEALTPVDILRRADVQVVVASVKSQATITGRSQITFSADTHLSQLGDEPFDLVVLPGGGGVLDLLDHPELKALLVAQAKSGRALAAICAAPKLLARHGLLQGRQATSHASVRQDLPLPSDLTTVTDGNITTSQGPGTAVEFALELVKILKGASLAREIAASLHFEPSA